MTTRLTFLYKITFKVNNSDYFELNEMGEMSIEEFKELVCSGENSQESHEALNEIIFGIDLNKDNRISFNEFKELVKKILRT